MLQQLLNSASTALNDCCNLKRSEKVLIICDPVSINIGSAFFKAAENRSQETVLVMVTPVNRPGRAVFSESVIEMVRNFNMAIILLSQKVSLCQMEKIASECAIRIISFPEINSDLLINVMQADWAKVGVYTRKIGGRLTNARKIRVVNSSGTDFTFETDDTHVLIEDGRLTADNKFGVLPAGKVSLVPKEHTLNGVIVVDGSISCMHGKLEKPLILKMQDGQVRYMENHILSTELEKFFGKNKENRYISFIGIGTLDTAQICGNLHVDKIARGAIHLVLGKGVPNSDQTCISPVLDLILECSEIYVDDKLLVQNGSLVNP